VSVQHLRFAVAWTIRQDPADIVVTRTQKQRSGGGWTNLAPVTLPAFRGRVAAGRELPREFVDQHAGEIRVDRGYVLVCKHTANVLGRDLVLGGSPSVTNVQDEFVHRLGRFRIVTVTPITYGGVTCGQVCDLESVGT
jgi:hypothetical protein